MTPILILISSFFIIILAQNEVYIFSLIQKQIYIFFLQESSKENYFWKSTYFKNEKSDESPEYHI